MEEEYDKVYAYLDSTTYPEGLSKDGKLNWRRKCEEYFKIDISLQRHKNVGGPASHQFHSSIFIVIVEYHAGSFDDVVACDRWFHHQ